MRVRVRYFASLREATGMSEDTLELPAGATAAEARSRLAEQHPTLSRLLPTCAIAINRIYAAGETPLGEGDELAFIPPVGGG